MNNVLSSCCADGRLTFDDALMLAAFYRDYSDTNSIIEAAEKEAAENADKLLSDTVSLLSEVEKFSAVGVAGIQSVDFEQLLMAESMMFAADVDEVISEELVQKINEAIDSLPAQCQQIIRMHIIDGKKYTEISAELKVSMSTIKTQIFRGYKKLRELLSDDFNALVLFYFHFHITRKGKS